MAADDTMLVRLPRALCAAWKVAPLCAVLRKVPVRTYRTLYISRCLQRGSNNPQQVLHLPTSLPWPRAWCCSLGVHSFSAAACNGAFHPRHERFVDLPSFEQRHASSLEPPRAVKTEPLCAQSVLVLPIAAAAAPATNGRFVFPPFASVLGWKSAPVQMDTYDPMCVAPGDTCPLGRASALYQRQTAPPGLDTWHICLGQLGRPDPGHVLVYVALESKLQTKTHLACAGKEPSENGTWITQHSSSPELRKSLPRPLRRDMLFLAWPELPGGATIRGWKWSTFSFCLPSIPHTETTHAGFFSIVLSEGMHSSPCVESYGSMKSAGVRRQRQQAVKSTKWEAWGKDRCWPTLHKYFGHLLSCGRRFVTWHTERENISLSW